MSGSVRFGQTDQFHFVVWMEAWKGVGNRFSGRRHAALQSTKNALFAFPHLAHLLTKKGRKMAVSPSLTIKNRSKTMERHEKPSKLFGKEKTLEPLKFQGFSSILELDQRLLNFLISCKTARHFRKHPRKLRWFCVFRSVLLDSGGFCKQKS